MLYTFGVLEVSSLLRHLTAIAMVINAKCHHVICLAMYSHCHCTF